MSDWIVKTLHMKGIHNKSVLFIVNHVLVGADERTFEIKRRLLNSIDYFDIGNNTKVVGPIICEGNLKIGKNCWIGKNFSISGNGSVIIGDNCDIAPNVTFQTGSHIIGDSSRRAGLGLTMNQTIGNGTWIGSNTTIIGNSNIGNGCVIASCACVKDDFEDNSLIGGVPAKIIRKLDE